MVKINNTTLKNWQNCVQISNAQLSLIATADVGPRIISLGLPGKRNLFYQNKEQIGLSGGNEWCAYGGHRFWIAPENDRTYFPDNRAVSVEHQAEGIRLTAPIEETNGFQKTIQIKLSAGEPHIQLIHELTNHSTQSQRVAPWALSVMAPGGTAILPHSPRIDWPDKLTAQNTLSMWSYTNMSDPRWSWGYRYILLRQTNDPGKPQKIGMFNSEGWAAYLLDDVLFVKFFAANPESSYPDLNSNLETWTNHEFLELETLGPLEMVEPGQVILHNEDWFLFGDVPIVKCDDDVENVILPLVKKCQNKLTTS
ncbi:MAG: hypothetical protein JXR32_06340 [Anaerolineaceae bacterium]|nr:hypothetical protein [Anaerolineaceae bacterium]